MIEIIPAILEQSLPAIEEKLTLLRGLARAVQIDVCDGAFVPQVTWPLADEEQRTELQRMVSQDEGLPLWEDFDFEFHLMMEEPAALAEELVAAGASGIIVHADAPGAHAALQTLQSFRGGEFPVSIGVAIGCDVAPEALTPFEGLYDVVQVMGIVKVGFQGQDFDTRATALVAQLRAENPTRTIQVDGGVGLHTARTLRAAGANRLVVGSGILKSEDPKEAIENLIVAADNNI